MRRGRSADTARVQPGTAGVLTVNGSSSSIKFALFEADGALRRILEGRIDGFGRKAVIEEKVQPVKELLPRLWAPIPWLLGATINVHGECAGN